MSVIRDVAFSGALEMGLSAAEALPYVGIAASAISTVQHGLQAYYDFKEGRPLRGLIDIAKIGLDIAQGVTDVAFPLALAVDAVAMAVPLLEGFLPPRGAKPSLTPEPQPAT